MASKYDEALAALYRAPFADFVGERKRLAAELLASGDGAGAARLGKITRPPVSAWAVNQLYWRDRKSFASLFKTAERLRDPDATAEETAAHRDTIATLRTHAATLLRDTGKSATEGTLRRIATTLSALAATGGFDPDPPGALKGDRDPPGFDVAGLSPSKHGKPKPDNGSKAAESKRQAAQAAKRERSEAAAERRRAEREAKQEKAERERLERKLRIAKGVHEARKEEVLRLKEKLVEAEEAVEGARGVVRDIEGELRKL